jgi:hypothetical protein
MLGRDRSGVRTLHIAEVLASTERDAATTHAEQPAESAQWKGDPGVDKLAGTPSDTGRSASASEVTA